MGAETRSILCPDCNGAGEREGIAHPGARLIRIECSYCEAAGYITPQRAEWREIGQAHRRARLGRYESLMECAERIGALASEISRFERGLIDPAMWQPAAPDPAVGFPFVVTCQCGAKTGFHEETWWRFECRDCGRLNDGPKQPVAPSGTSGERP